MKGEDEDEDSRRTKCVLEGKKRRVRCVKEGYDGGMWEYHPTRDARVYCPIRMGEEEGGVGVPGK